MNIFKRFFTALTCTLREVYIALSEFPDNYYILSRSQAAVYLGCYSISYRITSIQYLPDDTLDVSFTMSTIPMNKRNPIETTYYSIKLNQLIFISCINNNKLEDMFGDHVILSDNGKC